MLPRIITLRYIDSLHGFSEEPIRDASFGREILDFQSHFFMHGDSPRLVMVLKLSNYLKAVSSKSGGKSGKNGKTETKLLEERISTDNQKVYGDLKIWRNMKLKHDKLDMDNDNLPHNSDLLRMILASPKSQDELKTIPDITEGVVERYSEELWRILKTLKTPGEGIAPDGSSTQEASS